MGSAVVQDSIFALRTTARHLAVDDYLMAGDLCGRDLREHYRATIDLGDVEKR